MADIDGPLHVITLNYFQNLAHHILAQDVAAVENWYNSESHSSLSSTSPLPLPLFHFGPFGNVPLVYFAIHYQNVKLVRLLLSKDHRVTARIHHEDVVIFCTSSCNPIYFHFSLRYRETCPSCLAHFNQTCLWK